MVLHSGQVLSYYIPSRVAIPRVKVKLSEVVGTTSPKGNMASSCVLGQLSTRIVEPKYQNEATYCRANNDLGPYEH